MALQRLTTCVILSQYSDGVLGCLYSSDPSPKVEALLRMEAIEKYMLVCYSLGLGVQTVHSCWRYYLFVGMAAF